MLSVSTTDKAYSHVNSHAATHRDGTIELDLPYCHPSGWNHRVRFTCRSSRESVTCFHHLQESERKGEDIYRFEQPKGSQW